MNYAELIAEVANRTEAPGFAQRASQYTKQAEADMSHHFRQGEYPILYSVESAGTNWLLTDHQEIYIAALIKQYYLEKFEPDKAQVSDGYMKSMISDKLRADRMIKYRGKRPAIGGDTP